ncbi:bifunctional phosphopantothenoylcysteine decarboxylase/phosphopantothenate--cysteine ligase CoaBC [Oscillatoria sp. CS-180]|uniref:bifunctional phosphopantothenoylcysteine decarboxylase/phosphopantothenate--cysteine ligase CoaBC n=1 Tax=Oscillatoria sp. CS-180 TaxID=3021720 RepID=UPI00232E0DE0|nr:bifunctional phosphopantothenoylcysteine decarboxylase/phosphopantothenate--cysteine ligase CoaBC [Oscillatoria sp. CS-180]MDB9527272.1 bifunctional phosphopantothenoylcysteine decarboxylase/phosphopantothenate--cysteine ligase CoaBC [Oscillatoria sp. CS-180]
MGAGASNSRKHRVILGIGGGIAAYKVCEVASTLAKAGTEVIPVLTEQAQRFVTPLTLATLCRHPAYTDQEFWQSHQARPLHIELGETADLLVLAPLTANTLGKLTYGLADNLLTNTVLASSCPALLVPAMNTDMWQQQSVQRNWKQLQTDRRYHTIAPGTGLLACDRVGQGRMAEPAEILAVIDSLLLTEGKRDLAGKQILISTGSTHEYIDAVRFIGNPATGKMGVALAQAASHRGATVTLVHGPMATEHLTATTGIQQVSVTTSDDMQRVMMAHLPRADWIIMAAAVADVKPRDRALGKLPKVALPDDLPLVPVPDIAAHLAQEKSSAQVLIGFAAQTGDIETPAWHKLKAKGLDAIVANPIDQENSGFGSDSNRAILLSKTGDRRAVPQCSKRRLAHHIFDFVLQDRSGKEA